MAFVLRAVIINSEADSRASLRRILTSTPSTMVVGEFCDIPEALRAAPACRPDVLIVEIPPEQAMTGEGVSSTIEQLAHTLPETSILVTGPTQSVHLVIQVIRAGALDFLGCPVKEDELLRALDKVARSRRGHRAQPRAGHVTSVFSTKGGVGVTTVATNLAVCWAKRSPGSTLLVDLDTRQSDIATFLNLRSSYSVLDAFENLGRMDESLLHGLVTEHPSGLKVLLGPGPMERVKLSSDQVRGGLEILRAHFDQVILDLPHDVDHGTLAALEVSNIILFLVGLSVSALRSAAAGLGAFRHFGLDLDKVRLVVMREETGEDITLKHVRETLEIPIHWKTPSDYSTAVTAINSGEPIVMASPRSKIGKNLRHLSDMLFNAFNGHPGAETSAKRAASLLRMVWTPHRFLGGE